MTTFALLLTLIGAVVVDGDTLRHEGRKYRLWGIDAPEPNKPGGQASRDALSAILADQPLTCEVLDTDRYGRAVVRCTLPDGTDPACTLVTQGHARDWPRFSGGVYSACE